MRCCPEDANPMSDFFKESARSSILALHGFTGAGSDFEYLKSHYAKDCVWDAPDLPPRTLPELCGLLRERWENLAGTPRVLLGYSMGGRIALHLAKEISWNPCDLFVLISASPGIADERERSARRKSDEILAKKIEAFASSEKFYAEWQKHPLIVTQRRLPQPWRDRLIARRASADWRVWTDHLRLLGTGTLPSLWENLHEILAPEVILVVGEEDAKFRAVAEKMRAKLPRSRVVVVPGCGHSPHLENAEFFQRIF